MVLPKTNMKRIDQLLNMLETEPNDTFLLYAAALEYMAIGDTAQTNHYFEILLHSHPNYLATYYHAAQFYAEQAQTDKAKQTYENGIALALVQKNTKTLAELKNAYTNFCMEIE